MLHGLTKFQSPVAPQSLIRVHTIRHPAVLHPPRFVFAVSDDCVCYFGCMHVVVYVVLCDLFVQCKCGLYKQVLHVIVVIAVEEVCSTTGC